MMTIEVMWLVTGRVRTRQQICLIPEQAAIKSSPEAARAEPVGFKTKRTFLTLEGDLRENTFSSPPEKAWLGLDRHILH